ncbi:MAG: DHH family phosphoesterase [Methanomicrobiales archaeon]
MSLEEAAGRVAEHLERQEFVEVYAHHDADGITAASILCIAMLRKDMKFRLRVVAELPETGITPGQGTLLCDLGSGREDLPGDVMVVDHHIPGFSGNYHVNPRLFGIDGDHELSASGTAYLVANEIGDNRDLAGLAVTGFVGDGQELAGKNLEIFNEAVASRIITPGRGLHLPGRDAPERLYMSINPYLPGISGNQPVVESILDKCTGEEDVDSSLLLSLLVLETGQKSGPNAAYRLYGDTYGLEREVLPDAHTLAAVLDACGKAGKGGLAASICMRSSEGLPDAWETTRSHRLHVVGALDNACKTACQDGFYEVEDLVVASDVADALAYDCTDRNPVLVFSSAGEICHISARCPKGVTRDIGTIIREIARACGGKGGGHRLRAGATVPCTRVPEFRSAWQEAMAS